MLILLNGEVKLDPPMSEDVRKNVTGVVWGLNWAFLDLHSKELENLLQRIEAAKDGPGYNPHRLVTE